MTTKRPTPIAAARQAANEDFEAYLEWAGATAAQYVPDATVAAAENAYVAAGGKHRIEVSGRGNVSHPVCSVKVREVK